MSAFDVISLAVVVPEIVPIHLKCNNCMSAFDVILLAVGVPEIVPIHLKCNNLCLHLT